MLIVPGLPFSAPLILDCHVSPALCSVRDHLLRPFIPSCMALRLDPIAVNQTAQLFDFICEHEGAEPSASLISFGSALGLLMTQGFVLGRLGGVILFGGSPAGKRRSRTPSRTETSHGGCPPDP